MGKPDEEEDEGGSWLSARGALIVAAIFVFLVKTFVPFGDELLYPMTLFATWVHEMGHGLTGLVVGGSFDSLEIFWNGSGLAHGAHATGWPSALVSMGGLLGPPVVGAGILAFARGPKRASIVLWVLAGLMLVSVPIWVRSITGFVVIPVVAALFGLLAYKGGETLRHFGAQLIGVMLGLDTLTGLDYLFTGEAFVGGEVRPSDVSNISTALGGPYLLWGALLAVVSLALVALGVRIAWMSPIRWSDLRWPKRRKDVTSSAGGRSNL
ncbi:MAG: M50 family metallopeptidase [Sandaracinaceae bacterium]